MGISWEGRTEESDAGGMPMNHQYLCNPAREEEKEQIWKVTKSFLKR